MRRAGGGLSPQDWKQRPKKIFTIIFSCVNRLFSLKFFALFGEKNQQVSSKEDCYPICIKCSGRVFHRWKISPKGTLFQWAKRHNLLFDAERAMLIKIQRGGYF
jgi:hypothetical protein